MVPQNGSLMRLRAKKWSRAFALMITIGVSTAGFTRARAEVSSWGWRASLHRTGLANFQAQSIHAVASITPSTAYTQPPTKVAEPKPTTETLADLTQRRGLDPTRFDQNHSTLGPLLGEEARLKAGDCSNAGSFNGLLPNNPYYNYERWVRSLNPTSFDAKNPNLGVLLAEDQRVRTLIANCPAQQNLIPPASGTPAGTTAGGNGTGGTGNTPAVPEPASLALVLLGSGAILARRLASWLRQTMPKGDTTD